MKKIINLLLISLFLVSLSSCKKDNTPSNLEELVEYLASDEVNLTIDMYAYNVDDNNLETHQEFKFDKNKGISIVKETSDNYRRYCNSMNSEKKVIEINQNIIKTYSSYYVINSETNKQEASTKVKCRYTYDESSPKFDPYSILGERSMAYEDYTTFGKMFNYLQINSKIDSATFNVDFYNKDIDLYTLKEQYISYKESELPFELRHLPFGDSDILSIDFSNKGEILLTAKLLGYYNEYEVVEPSFSFGLNVVFVMSNFGNTKVDYVINEDK